MDATNRVVAGWILEERLGSGGFGEVWKARRRHVDLFRALKLVPIADEQAFAGWRHEISRLEDLSHPNIVRFYDADIVGDGGRYDDYAWIATELCERSLADELDRRDDHRLSSDEARELLDGMLSALAAAHASGCVHRDVKPANILRHSSGVWKLCDFGTARLIPAGESHPRTAVVGTFPYMSPAAHRGRQDQAADLYALGVTIHEALCGERLHPRSPEMTDSEYVKLILDMPPTISPRLDPRWRGYVAALIGADGTHTAEELLTWLRQPDSATTSAQGEAPELPDVPDVPATLPAAGVTTTPAAGPQPTLRQPRQVPDRRSGQGRATSRPSTSEPRGDRVHLGAILALIGVSLGIAGLLIQSLVGNVVILAAILGTAVLILLVLLLVS
ncbi:MAG TPA: serine/threonine-protein kinase [Acidimicrobiales bacterium]|nr:serine/threonine-protein kinase [Acidimicrobiales bacterium]